MTSIPNPIRSAVMAHPESISLTCGETLWSWRELHHRTLQAAHWLKVRGVEAGDLVALTASPSPEWVAMFHAVGWLGGVAVPMNPRLTRLEADGQLSQLRPRLIWDGADSNPWEASGDEVPEERAWPMDEVRVMLFTSGTSGKAKSVELTTGQLVFNAMGSAIRLGHLPSDRWLNCLPLHHVGGLSIIVRCALYGTTMALHPRFDAKSVADALDTAEITQVSLTPTMWRDVLNARTKAPFPSGLRTVLVGGAGLPDAVRDAGRAIGAPVAETWGMTETASQACTRSPILDPTGSGVGAPLPFTRIEENEGQLVVSGPIANGRITTADTGTVREDGSIHIAGRADDIIISGGLNISPAEIEAILIQHPDITDIAVVGLPCEDWGARPHAMVVARKPDALPETPALRSWCAQRTANYKIPDSWRWVSALPRDELGKLSRNRVQSALVDLGEQADAVEASGEGVGTVNAPKVSHADESVLQTNDTTQVIDPVAQKIVAKSDGPTAELLDAGPDNEIVGLSDGTTKISFTVDQGRTEPEFLEEVSKTAEGSVDELFVTNVGVLEDAPKENDSSPVDFVETRSDRNFEIHERAPRSQRTHER